MSLTIPNQCNSVKGERLSSLGYCSKVADEIDLFSFRLLKVKSHASDKMSSIVDKITHGVDIATNKEDDITISSRSSPSSKDSDSKNVSLEIHSEGILSSNSKRSKGIKIQVKNEVCARWKIWKKGNAIVKKIHFWNIVAFKKS